LGGDDFGGHHKNLQGAHDEAVKEVKSDIKGFVAEEIESKLTEIMLKGDDLENKDLQKLFKLADKVGYDFKDFNKKWEVRKHDLGLVLWQPPQQSGSQDNQQQRQRNPYEMKREEEFQISENSLRAIYMKQAITGNLLTALQYGFKMRKHKNQMIKLCVQHQEPDFKRLKEEGKELAIAKFREMLEEVMQERSTLYKLAGPAYKMVEKKTQLILSNLRRLKAVVSEEEIERLIVVADQRMHDVAMEELKAVEALVESKAYPAAMQKRAQLVKLVLRLRAEAKIVAQPLNLPEVSEKT